METSEDFKNYFNRDFWRSFSKKKIIINIPNSKADRNILIENVYTEISNKSYSPEQPERLLHRDKGSGVTRVIPVFSLRDYCVYYYCIKKLEPKVAINRVENTFGGWTLGGLMRKSEEDEMTKRKSDFDDGELFMRELNGFSVTEYSFNPVAWSRAYGDLNAKLYATSLETEFNFVAELDIANFYDSIRLDILEIKIREIAGREDEEAINLLFYFLNYWNRKDNLYNKQTVGIPQDAIGDFSRILANFYLQDYDEYMLNLCKQRKCRFLRYADDQFIFADNKEDLCYLIHKASLYLNKLGLSINQKKVKIKTTDELMRYRAFEIFELLTDENSKKNKDKVEVFVEESLKEINEHGDALQGHGIHLVNRALSCPAVFGIKQELKDGLLEKLLKPEYLLFAPAYKLEQIYLLLGSVKKREEFIKMLIELSNKSIHNVFHYDVLSFMENKKIESKKPILERITILQAI